MFDGRQHANGWHDRLRLTCRGAGKKGLDQVSRLAYCSCLAYCSRLAYCSGGAGAKGLDQVRGGDKVNTVMSVIDGMTLSGQLNQNCRTKKYSVLFLEVLRSLPSPATKMSVASPTCPLRNSNISSQFYRSLSTKTSNA
jgi:hypothetical protein